MRKAATGYIFVTLLLDVLGFGLLIPVGPKLVQQLQGGTETDAAGPVGYLAATYAVMQLLCAPMLGALSDRFGRRRVLLVSQLGSGLDYFAMALAPTLWVLFLTRAINGLSGASMTVANAYIADVTPPEGRSKAFGMMGAAFGIGFVLGPLMGGLLGEIDIRWPFYAAGVVSLVSAAWGVFVLPESLPPERRSPFHLARANPLGAFVGLGRYPVVAGMAVAMFLSFLAQFGLHATWVLYTSHRYHWSPRDVGLSLFTVGVGAAVVQAGLAPRLIRKIGERASILISLAMAVLIFAGYGLATHGWMIYAIIAVGSLAGFGQPAIQAVITKAVDKTEQGAVQGTLTAIQGVAAVVGPLAGSAAFKHFSVRGAGHPYVPGAAFFIGSGLSLLALGAATRALRGYRPAPAAPAA